MRFSNLVAPLTLGATTYGADLSGHKFLITSIRTGDTEIFIADPTTGDLFNVSRSPTSEDRYPTERVLVRGLDDPLGPTVSLSLPIL